MMPDPDLRDVEEFDGVLPPEESGRRRKSYSEPRWHDLHLSITPHTVRE